jgi:hypothetical protein
VKIKFSIFFIIFFLSFKVIAGDDLTGKGIYCYTKDLIIYLDFNSQSKVDVHYLQRYNADYVTNPSGLTEAFMHNRVKYRYKHRTERYSTTNQTIDIDYGNFNYWIRVLRQSLKLMYENRWQIQQDINKLYPFHGGYLQKNDVMKDEEPIYCRVDNNLTVTQVKDFIESTAKSYNNKINSEISEQKKKEEEESKKVNKI